MKVLLVEDDDDHAELLLRSLGDDRLAHAITRAHDGAEAIAHLFGDGPEDRAAARRRPDLVLLDLRLPRVDGLEVLKKIRTSSHLAALPVVIMSTSQADTDMARAYQYDANVYVTKPEDFSNYLALVDDLRAFVAELEISTAAAATED